MIKDIAFGIAALIFAIALGAVYMRLPNHGEVVYNCSIAEFSPDFPPKAREECRKLRSERI